MIAVKALSKNPFKSILIFSSITIAVMAIFLISSVSQGVIGMYSKMIKTDGDIIITQKGISDTFFSNVDVSLIEQINKIDNVKSSYAMIVGASPVGHLPIAAIYGTTENHFSHYKLSKGNYPKEGQVLLGKSIFNQIQSSTIEIGSREFELSGIFSSDIGFEEGGVVMNIVDAGKLFNRSASFILISSISPNIIDELVKK